MPRTLPGVQFIFMLFLLSLSCHVVGQNPSYVSVKPQTGFIIPHSQSISQISDSRPYGAGVEYGWFLKQNRDWERCNCYSKAGLSLLHMNFNAPEILGSSTTLIGYAEPLLNYRGFLKASFRMGTGVSYLSKVYDAETNPENKFFSTRISFLVHADFNLMKFITDHWFINAYFKYNHISNGGMKEPNKGMNFPSYGIGVGYAFQDVRFQEREKKKLNKPVPVVPGIKAFGTLKNTEGGTGTAAKAPSIGVMIKARRKFTPLNAINIGLEGNANYALKKRMEQSEDPVDHREFSFLVGHDFLFGKFAFSQYWGTYIYAPFYKNKDFFQRYSLTYDVYKDFHIGVTLKAHAQVAQNFFVMVGYDFE